MMICSKKPKKIKSKPIYLIRHGESLHNLAMNNALLPDGSENLDVKFSVDFVDALITQTGKEQAEKANKIVIDKNIKYVVCSPIRRCIETAQIIFKNHPNKPKIIITPYIRELQCCAADIGTPLDELQVQFPDIDWSPMKRFKEPHIWHIVESFEKKTREEILLALKKVSRKPEEQKKVAYTILLERMRSVYPTTLETYKDVVKRVELAQVELKKIMKNLNDDETIAVVSHYGFLKFFTSPKFDENYKPLDGRDFLNCEVYEHILDQKIQDFINMFNQNESYL